MIGWLVVAALAGPEVCGAKLTRDARDPAAWRCFYDEARADGSWVEAEDALHRALLFHGREPLGLAALGGVVGDQRGREEEANGIYVEALGLAAARPPLEMARLRLAYSSFLIQSLRLDEATEQLKQAAVDASGDTDLQAEAWAQQARLLWRQERDYDAALALVHQARAVGFPDGPYRIRLLCLHVEAALLQELGRFSESRRVGDALVELVAAEGDDFVLLTVMSNHLTLLLEHDLGQSTRDVEELIARIERVGERIGDERARVTAACARVAVGAADVAATARCAESDEAYSIMQAWGYAASRMMTVDAEAARAMAAEIRPAEGLYTETEVAYLRAVLEAAPGGGDPTPFEEQFLQGLDELILTQPDANVRARFLAPWSGALHHVAFQRLRFGPEAALRVVERRRAMHLQDRLELSGVDVRPPGAEPWMDAVAALREVIEELAWLQPDDPVRSALVDQHLALRRAERRARSALASAHPQWGRVYAPTELSLERVQASLHPDEVLVSYQWSGPELYRLPEAPGFAVVIQQHRVDVVPLADVDLEGATSMFVSAMSQPDSTIVPRLGRALFEALIAPVLAVAPTARALTVIPDGPLHALPFGALSDADGSPLSASLPIGVAPSVAMFQSLRLMSSSGAGALSLADPPTEQAALPRARQEARTMVRRLGGRLLVGGQASLPAMTEGLERSPGLLHLGLHATVDRRDPRASRVDLADGPLDPKGIAQLHLRGVPVVLAACNGAAGEAVEGAGLLGLVSAFLEAGAPAVVATMLPMRDDEAEVLIQQLALRLSQGATLTQAVADAQSAVRAAGWPTRAWAPLVVVGDGHRSVSSAGRPTRVLQGAALGLLLGLLSSFPAWRTTRSRPAR